MSVLSLSLQAASSEPYVEVKTGNHEMVSRTLHIQAAKVVAAHAASVGDALLGVPLLCSAGELLACCFLHSASCNPVSRNVFPAQVCSSGRSHRSGLKQQALPRWLSLPKMW